MRLVDRAIARLPQPWRSAAGWLVTIGVALAAVLIFEAEIAKPFRIPSSSMEPTLHCARPAVGCDARFSDRVIACRICYVLGSPSRGQIVVFRAPPRAVLECGAGGVFVKRLIGLPGDSVHEDSRGFLSIDGRRLTEPYVSAADRAADTKFRDRTWRVPSGDYFMIGDNRGGSCDSRTWGPVPRGNLIGPVVLTYWPPNRLGLGYS